MQHAPEPSVTMDKRRSMGTQWGPVMGEGSGNMRSELTLLSTLMH